MTRRLLLPLAALWFATAACDSEKDDTGGDAIGTGDDTGTGGDDGGSDGETPVITDMDAWCYLHKTGDKAYFWVVDLQAEDPQGNDTLESFVADAVVVLSGDTEVASYALVCEDDGHCFSSFNESEDNVSCANASSYTFRATVVDDDGNVSDPATVQGREGTDASGR